ncbi:MAG TPA: hypothetical protein VKC60_08945 [Opitutaceae bacterium]|nr:hypothetical protein [Opitutaceae bacterium]
MNSKCFASMTVLMAGIWMAGCASSPPPRPRINYPVTYQINIGNTQVRSEYGPQNLNVSATQQVMVQPGQPLYYQVYSPVNVTVYVYERASSNTRRLLGQMQGTSFTTAVTPSVDMLEFVFSAAQSNTGGVVQFTLSDRPLAVSPPPALH